MIDKTTTFEICPDTTEAKNGCEFCPYWQRVDQDYRCLIFMALDEGRLSFQPNFCPVCGKLNPNYWGEGPNIFASYPDGTLIKIKSIDDIKQKELFTFEALCVFWDDTSAWVSLPLIKNEEEIGCTALSQRRQNEQ